MASILTTLSLSWLLHIKILCHMYMVPVCVSVSVCMSVYSYSIRVFLCGSLDCMNETVTI